MNVSLPVKIVASLIIIGSIGLGVYVFAKKSPTELSPASVAVVPVKMVTPPDHPIQVPILTYHTIAPATTKPQGKMEKHYHITPEHFDAQMKYLADNGYDPIRFDTYAKYLTGDGDLPEKPVVLTFDDGWKNQYDHAYPILEKYGFTATFFIMSKVTGGSYMTWDNIRDLDTKGFEIASHTAMHAKLTEVTDETKLRDEIFTSKEKIESEIGHTISTIAYPYYQQNETIRKLVKDAGYIAARAGWAKADNSIDTIFQLKSQEAVNTDNPFSTKIK